MVIIDKQNRPRLASDGGNVTRFAETYEWGCVLADTPTGVGENSQQGLWEAIGWKEMVQHMPRYKQPLAAIYLENARRKWGKLHEATRASNLGTFDKWIFPIIANMTENDLIDQLVAVQPMAGPTGQIVYLDIVTEKRKGRIPQGAPMWRAIQGAVDRSTDMDETIEAEPVSVTPAADALASFTLEYTPIRPGTVQLTIGTVTTQDDGNGSFIATSVGASNITGGSIDYVTGIVSAVTTSGLNGSTVSVTYVYNSEGNTNIQGFEVKTTSAPVTAKVCKLRSVWSEESEQNLQSMYNIGAESVFVNPLVGALQYQKHRQVIYDIRNRADAGFVAWDAQAPSGVNYQAHKFTLLDAIEVLSFMIFGATNLVTGNWVLTGLQGASVLTTLPQFNQKGDLSTMRGITHIGDINGKKVFADPHFPVNEFVVGHKGDQFFTTGYVLAEYQKLYTTPDIMLPDFNHQRGFATSFAKMLTNPKMFGRGLCLNSPTSFGTTIG